MAMVHRLMMIGSVLSVVTNTLRRDQTSRISGAALSQMLAS